MHVGVVFAGGNWPAVIEAVHIADTASINAIGFWDHFHSERLDYAPVSGWSVYGALAMLTKRIHLIPLVLDRPNYSIGVLAKESSMLALMSQGRFELGIGIGDFPAEEAAWGLPAYPDGQIRITELQETIAALRSVWSGEQVDFSGQYVQLHQAGCRPAPPTTPRVVVGAGRSRRLVQSAVQYADEINVYNDPELVQFARTSIATTNRHVDVSVAIDEWEDWDRAVEDVAAWNALGVSRVFVTLYQPYTFLPQVCDLAHIVMISMAKLER